MDVAHIRQLSGFEMADKAYSIGFYDITLVTRGSGHFWLDQHCITLQKGQLIFSTPSCIRRGKYSKDFEGISLFFDEDFFLNVFNDANFLHKLGFFYSLDDRVSILLNSGQFTKTFPLFQRMLDEIQQIRSDSAHMLRAVSYQILIQLNRYFLAVPGSEQKVSIEGKLAGFRQLLETHFKQQHRVSFYAEKLCISNNYLNALCKKHLNLSVSHIIENRIIREACRFLLHTNNNVSNIGFELGYKDPSYFCKSFKKIKLLSPSAYRRKLKYR